MSVRKKLNLGFISLTCLLFISSIVSFLQFKATQNDLEEVLQHRIVQMQLTVKIQQELASQGLFLRSYILNQKDETAKANLERYEKLLPESVNELSTLVRSDYTKNIMQQITALQKDLLTHSEEAVQAFNNGNVDLALSYINNDVTKDNKEIFQLTKEMLEYHNEQLQKVDAEVNQTVARAIIISITLLLASVVIGVYFMFFVKRSIVQPLRQAIGAADTLAQGDLTIDELT
ncbi:MAG TPA: methyl-accepting chemotaxis protein, partial [Lysinibacillus sp.]|nr:methyl-accepting chemotaxis protein [Lysinibacillus sp.]